MNYGRLHMCSRVLILSGVCYVAASCTSEHTPPRADASMDSATQNDDLGSHTPDLGVAAEVDANVVDMFEMLDLGLDAGTGSDAGCTPGAYSASVAGQCTTDAEECLRACTTSECQQGCLAEHPACGTCVFVNEFACYAAHGCRVAMDAHTCCFSTYCADATAAGYDACMYAHCFSETNALTACLDSIDVPTACPRFIEDCF